MKVLNIHTREFDQPKAKVMALFDTLASPDDSIWPKELWPRMKLDKGLAVGSKGGHGSIRYQITSYQPEQSIEFRFQKPVGFVGIHKFEVLEKGDNETIVTHTIDMHTSGTGTLLWLLGIRALHDALLEDALDNIENQLTGSIQKTDWSPWVKLLRMLLK